MTSTPQGGDRVLVTGAAGFVGRRLCTRLQADGARVTAIVERADDGSLLPAGVTVATADVTDAGRVRDLFEATRPDVVFHLAAMLAPSRDLADLPAYVAVNTLGTASILAAAAVTRPRHVVTAGTVEECGPDVEVPVGDDAPLDPRTPYGISKALATRMCLDAWRADALPVTVARLFQLYGPGMPPRFFVRQLLDATLEGRTLDMTEGRQARDFTHVDDVAEGLLAIARCAPLRGRVVNLCSGREHSLREVCAMWERITGRTGVVRLGVLPYRPHEVFRSVGDPARLRGLAGWAPRIALEDGLRALWAEATAAH